MVNLNAIGDIVRKVPYFDNLDDTALVNLTRRVRARSYSPGEAILIEGLACEGLSFVISGHVRVYRSTPDGREQVLRVVGPGRTFNDAAALDEGLSAESAMALGPVTVGLIPSATLRVLFRQHPEVPLAATRLMATRQRALAHMVEALAMRDITARVARLLLGCVGQHEDMVEGAPDACARITQQEIATMIGSVREVVQRALKKLEKAGAIEVERTRIRVVDMNALERFSEAPSD
ncbi:Crp/Fnr family transcriptional regulator [Maritimibacter sp. 55A14]|uniref:Crp/Fnr family transcriptional regulator n=1 Tax=Maritimibacter sp. 55A14 TaxID=2174844 RepID=UPI000D6179FD|nr:Crp/Fnr family transcriptional regulator [Maritimibacter sp. 55A14]PWE31246.1 Crp/Fnr family transcriptional regulator [Maritimibacter sp. 55A14]